MFFGEWLFGSIGWGVLHGSLFFVALALTAVMVALAFNPIRLFLWFLLAFVIGILASLIFGFDVLNEAYAAIGNALLPGVDAANRPLVTGMLLVGLIALVIGLVLFFRMGGAGTFRESPGKGIVLLVLTVLVSFLYGALLGAFSAITFGRQVGAALGVAVALLLWPVLIAFVLSRRGVDFDAIKARLWPDVTIETTKETIEWVRERTPLGRKS